MNLEPYLLLNGAEIANLHRTLTYLRAGLAGADFDICLASPRVVGEGSGYSDVYSDVYGADRFETRNLCCYCSVFDFGNYQDPAYDEAPWYDPARPESAEFFGLWPEVRLAPVAQRNVVARARGRGDVGPLRVGPRVLQVVATMYAGSRAGMAYGERWLGQVLTGGTAEGCADDVLTVLPSCPPDSVEDGDTYLREVANIGVVDGPVFAPVQSDIPECVINEVSFQWAAGEPWLRATTELYSGVPASLGCESIEAPISADAASVVTIHAGGSVLDGIVIRGKLGGCPGSTVFIELTLDDMPAGSMLVIDASREIATLTTSGGSALSAFRYLTWSGIFGWIKAPAGQIVSLEVDTSGATGLAGATMTVERVVLEY